ncbi:MAG: undecaprenyldiphospho-muramoylpentapeptide beta-N-acetylglucosaminyltransferase [Verrucomicrobiota bacterium]
MSLKIAIACGGTGGHLFPGLAVSKELQNRGHETVLLVSPKQIDAIALKGSGEKSHSLPNMGFPGLFNPKVLKFAWTLWQSRQACKKIYREFQPDAVLGMGGFTCAVPLMLAGQMGKPTLIHDSNAYPGKVTRLLAPKMTKTLLGFEDCAQHLPNANCVTVGTPVRQGLERIDRAAAAAQLAMDPAKFTVLVMGGSQGARGINDVIIKTLAISHELADRVQFLHLAGPTDAETVAQQYAEQPFQYRAEPFASAMELYYSLADLVVARSGASSLNETAHYGLPSLLIPYPYAADDHQALNAAIFEQAGAALVYAQHELDAETLKRDLVEFLGDETKRFNMSRAAQALAGTNAAAAVANEVEACVQN